LANGERTVTLADLTPAERERLIAIVEEVIEYHISFSMPSPVIEVV
jgi:hypothetical protein